jgi:hypothetical protein
MDRADGAAEVARDELLRVKAGAAAPATAEAQPAALPAVATPFDNYK